MKLYAILFLFVFSCKEVPQQISKVSSPDEINTLLEAKDIQLIDVRTPKEYKAGFIDGAKNIDFFSPTFLDDINKLDKKKPVIVYCKRGGRSAKSAKKFQDAGFMEIYDLEGGITNWDNKGYILVKD